MKHSVIITYPLKDRHIQKIRTELDRAHIYFFPDRHTPEKEYELCDIYFGHLSEHEFVHMPALKLVQAAYAGVDGLLFPALSDSGVIVCSAKGIHNVQMSELLFAALLYIGRNIPAWQTGKKNRSWDSSYVKEGFFLAGKQICIVGCGTICRRVAKIAAAFDMNVTGVRTGSSGIRPEEKLFIGKIYGVHEIKAALRDADIVVNLLPLTHSTFDFFDNEKFGYMKERSVFVNLGRGKTVDDTALLTALDSGRISYAILDVFRTEPLPPDHPLWDHPRIFITPHIGGLIPGYWDTVVDLFLENVKRLDAGETLLNEVNKKKGY
jgi:D-2-hydroxyacid dehydrogenase (NADP+)